jgi:hypothetical protein
MAATILAPTTAMPQAAASLLDDPKPTTTAMMAIMSAQLTSGR